MTGYKAHFTGVPYGKEREEQEEKLFVTTRGKQWFLKGASDNSDAHCVINNVTDEGYDYDYCHELDAWTREEMRDKEATGVEFVENLEFEDIVITGCRSMRERCKSGFRLSRWQSDVENAGICIR